MEYILPEILGRILKYCSSDDVVSFACTSTSFNTLTNSKEVITYLSEVIDCDFLLDVKHYSYCYPRYFFTEKTKNAVNLRLIVARTCKSGRMGKKEINWLIELTKEEFSAYNKYSNLVHETGIRLNIPKLYNDFYEIKSYRNKNTIQRGTEENYKIEIVHVKDNDGDSSDNISEIIEVLKADIDLVSFNAFSQIFNSNFYRGEIVNYIDIGNCKRYHLAQKKGLMDRKEYRDYYSGESLLGKVRSNCLETSDLTDFYCSKLAAHKNRHDILYRFLLENEFIDNCELLDLISYKSDPTTVSMILAKLRTDENRCYYLAKTFIDYSNYESLDVFLKYYKARFNSKEFLGLVSICIFISIKNDDLRCLEVSKNYVDMDNEISLECYALRMRSYNIIRKLNIKETFKHKITSIFFDLLGTWKGLEEL